MMYIFVKKNNKFAGRIKLVLHLETYWIVEIKGKRPKRSAFYPINGYTERDAIKWLVEHGYTYKALYK